MPKTLFEHLSPDTGAKAHSGARWRRRERRADARHAESRWKTSCAAARAATRVFGSRDYYDLIGGTSTGAIIASGLALGLSVDELIALYMRLGPDVFGKNAGDGVFLQSKFDVAQIAPRVALGVVDEDARLARHQDRPRHSRQAHRHGLRLGGHQPSARRVSMIPSATAASFPNKRYRLTDLSARERGRADLLR
jgi:hypothetical protein